MSVSVLRRPPPLLPREPSTAHLLTWGVSARSGCLQGDHTHTQQDFITPRPSSRQINATWWTAVSRTPASNHHEKEPEIVMKWSAQLACARPACSSSTVCGMCGVWTALGTTMIFLLLFYPCRVASLLFSLLFKCLVACFHILHHDLQAHIVKCDDWTFATTQKHANKYSVSHAGRNGLE